MLKVVTNQDLLNTEDCFFSITILYYTVALHCQHTINHYWYKSRIGKVGLY